MQIVLIAELLLAGILSLISSLLVPLNQKIKWVSQRLLKEVLVTLVLFNSFNIAYSTGIHFAYADRGDKYFIIGTISAVLCLLISFGIMCALSFAK